MSVHVYSSSDAVVLERWSIRETETGTRHFVGYSVLDHEGRVSTPVVSFDPESRTGATESGSTYTLIGRAGRDGDAEFVWSHATRAWKVKEWRDITTELVPDWRMWVSKAERLAMGDNEGEVISYPDVSQISVGPNEVYRMGEMRYRARAYAGRHANPQSDLKPVSTVTGSGSIVFVRPVPDDRVLQRFIATRVLLAEKMKRNGTVDEIFFDEADMTVTLESLSREDDKVGERLAHLYMTHDDSSMRTQLLIPGQPELTFGPIVARQRERVWKAVLLILPDWGDAGFVSRWE